MWKIHEIREIIKLFEESSFQEFELELEEGSLISLRKQGGTVVSNSNSVNDPVPLANVDSKPAVSLVRAALTSTLPAEKKLVRVESHQTIENPKSNPVMDQDLHKIVSPMVGTFYQAPSEDADPFVKPGDKVNKTSIVCIVEAMKLFNEIEAEVHGEIVEVLVKNGQLVELGQPLFLVKTE